LKKGCGLEGGTSAVQNPQLEAACVDRRIERMVIFS